MHFLQSIAPFFALKWIFTECRDRWALALGALGTSALTALATAGFAAIAGPLLIALSNPQEALNIPATGSGVFRADPGLLLFAAVILLSLRIAGDYAGQHFAARFLNRVVASLRTRLLGHVAALTPSHLKASPEELAARVAYDVAGISSLLNVGLFGLFRNVALVIALAAVVASVAKGLLVWTGLCFILAALVLWISLRHTRRAHRRVLAAEAEVIANATETLAHAEVAKSAGAQTKFLEDNSAVISKAGEQAIRASDLQARLPLLVFAAVIFSALVAWLLSPSAGIGLEISASITLGVAALLLVRPLIGLAQSLLGLSAGLAALDRMEELVASPSPVEIVPAESDATPAQLSLEHVHFAYASTPVLEDVCLQVPRGRIVTIVGDNAAGKSTLLRLCAGHLKAQHGGIRLADTEVASIAPSFRRRWIGWLPQDPPLFRASLRDNIAFGGASPDPERIQEMLRLLELEPLLERLDQGLDTQLGETVQHLSDGEIQRIALARVLYQKPAFLLLDEPSAHLDKSAQACVAFALQSFALEGGGVLLATHRASMLSLADEVWELQGGLLKRRGNAVQRAITGVFS